MTTPRYQFLRPEDLGKNISIYAKDGTAAPGKLLAYDYDDHGNCLVMVQLPNGFRVLIDCRPDTVIIVEVSNLEASR